jgi:DNA polymerase III epsilon subunit family exonuclease
MALSKDFVMPSLFQNSGFYEIVCKKKVAAAAPTALLGGVSGSSFDPTTLLNDIPIVVFDFETTGIDPRTNRIIEVGAIKYVGRKEVGRVSQLIHPEMPLPQEIISITGITNEMLVGAPPISQVLPSLHDLMRGSVGVAHNADFDAGFLSHESARLGMHCDYHLLCTLKMSRALVKIPRHKLDTLAAHYNLQFESRHRSIGDILVTAQLFWRMLDENKSLRTLQDVAAYKQDMLTF